MLRKGWKKLRKSLLGLGSIRGVIIRPVFEGATQRMFGIRSLWEAVVKVYCRGSADGEGIVRGFREINWLGLVANG